MASMADKAFVLIVEDELAHGEAIAEGLSQGKYVCNVVGDGATALDSLHHRSPDVVITDYKLGGSINGMDVLREAKRVNPEA